MVQFPHQGIFVTVPYGLEISVGLMNRNVMADTSWNGSSVNERRSLTFKDGANPGLFQLQVRGDSSPPKKGSILAPADVSPDAESSINSQRATIDSKRRRATGARRLCF